MAVGVRPPSVLQYHERFLLYALPLAEHQTLHSLVLVDDPVVCDGVGTTSEEDVAFMIIGNAVYARVVSNLGIEDRYLETLHNTLTVIQ